MDLEGDRLDPDAMPEPVASARSGNDLDSSGSCVNEKVGDRVESRDSTVEVNKTEGPSCSPGMNSTSPSASAESARKKGYGLKKWKRIRRVDVITNINHDLDTGKVLKRGLSASNNPLSPARQLAEEKQGTADFVEPVNTLEKNLGDLKYFPAQASSSIAFAVGAVSENSEDQSSKSSTAASALRHGFDMPFVSPFSWEKNKQNNLSGKGSNHSTQKGQLGRGRADPSKKLRGGERVKYEKENSHSSMESDSRSSNFVFMQVSNGRQSEASINYNEESDGDIPGADDQTAYSEVNARETEDISSHNLGADLSWEGNEESGGNHRQPPARVDPLVDSVLALNSVQEALEKELQKFKEIGKGSYFTSPDPASSVNSSDYFNLEELSQNASGSFSLEEKISSLESQLGEARDALRVKDSRVCELEATLNSESVYKGDSKSEARKQEATEKLEAELEILFHQRIEADIKYLVTANALQEAKHAPANPKTILAEQKALVDEQSHLRNMLRQTECKVVKITTQAKELKMYSEEIMETEQALSLQKSVSKLKWYTLAQMLMLLLALWIVYLQVVSDSDVVVPT
ncbi:hypothetical protein QQ045_007520 [Rhodiola kirilowii]